MGTRGFPVCGGEDVGICARGGRGCRGMHGVWVDVRLWGGMYMGRYWGGGHISTCTCGWWCGDMYIWGILPPQDLSLRVTVAESGEDGRADNTGHVLIGPAASGMGITHWNQMLATLRKPVSMWHPLRRN